MASTVLLVGMLFSPFVTAPAHAGIMDYMFNAFKDLTTPVEPVTPAEEIKTPITHPSEPAPGPAHTLVFDIRDAKTGEAISEATCMYHIYDEEGANTKGSVTFKEKSELALPAGSVATGVTVWAPGWAAKAVGLELRSKPERIEVPVRLQKGISAGGTVVNEDGLPVEGALVEARALHPNRGGVLLGEFNTDAQGRWGVQNVPEETEKLILRVAHPGCVPSCKMDSARDGGLTVAVGQNMQIRLVRGVSLSGRVVDQQAIPWRARICPWMILTRTPPSALAQRGIWTGVFTLSTARPDKPP
jgi:hypothetical protein